MRHKRINESQYHKKVKKCLQIFDIDLVCNSKKKFHINIIPCHLGPAGLGLNKMMHSERCNLAFGMQQRFCLFVLRFYGPVNPRGS